MPWCAHVCGRKISPSSLAFHPSANMTGLLGFKNRKIQPRLLPLDPATTAKHWCLGYCKACHCAHLCRLHCCHCTCCSACCYRLQKSDPDQELATTLRVQDQKATVCLGDSHLNLSPSVPHLTSSIWTRMCLTSPSIEEANSTPTTEPRLPAGLLAARVSCSSAASDFVGFLLPFGESPFQGMM